jgi:FkbM family methyltransferase
LSEKIKPFNFGLGQADTTLEIPYVETATIGMSTTHDIFKNHKDAKTETVAVKDAAVEIDSVISENKNKYIIVKCDCEGAEFEIFEKTE